MQYKMRKDYKLLLILFIIAVFLSFSNRVYATEINDDYGNAWVYDESQVVSHETEDYIKNLNENVFANYAGKPQLAFIIIDNLPYNIDDYKLDMFNEFGVGTTKENRGMLFVFAINDREYALEIGDGFEKGSMIRKDLETDFITDDMKNSLRSKNYDSVVMQVTQYLAGLMSDEENGVYAQKEAEVIAKDQEAANVAIEKINRIGEINFSAKCNDRIKEAQQAYVDLTPAQKELVTNYGVLTAARDKYDELTHEAFGNFMKKAAVFLAIACPIVGVIGFLGYLLIQMMRNDRIKNLINRHYNHFKVAAINEDEFAEYLKVSCKDKRLDEIEENFLNILHAYYMDKQEKILCATYRNHPNLNKYINRLRNLNNIHTFKMCNLTSLPIIVRNVNEDERKKAEMLEKNKKIVADFWNKNRSRVENDHVAPTLYDKLKKLIRDDRELRESELEIEFVEQKDRLNFKCEFDKFVAANRNKLENTSDFNADEFYQEVMATQQYRNYYYQRKYDRSWMLPLFIMHVHRRKEARIERERYEKKQRQEQERRRREAAAYRQASSIRSNNSSFGGGFGGGRSSGGGMRGGW